jgi:hypothetical protein
MVDKDNQNAASIKMQPSKHVPIDEVIFNREDCKSKMHDALDNHFSKSDRHLQIQNQLELLICYVEYNPTFDRDELATKLSLCLDNIKLLSTLEVDARPLFDKSHLNYLPNGKF